MIGFKSADVDRRLAQSADRFDALTMAMHWGSLLLLAAIFAAGWALSYVADAAAEATLDVHRSAGFLLWLLTFARLGWKGTCGRSAALPHSVGLLQAAIARATQHALYLLLLLQPITGLLQTVLRGQAFPLLGVSVPMLMARNRGLTKIFHGAHEVGGWALLVLIGAHTGAALFHHFVLRDGVLRAMLPRAVSRGSAAQGEAVTAALNAE